MWPGLERKKSWDAFSRPLEFGQVYRTKGLEQNAFKNLK